MIFVFLLCHEKAHDNKQVTKIQNLVANHESQSIKLNPENNSNKLFSLHKPLSTKSHAMQEPLN